MHITELSDVPTSVQPMPAYAKDIPAAGNLSTLCTLITNSSDEEMEFAYLLCARLFVSMQELLAKIIELCQSQEDRLLHLLTHWLGVCVNDFRNEAVLQELQKHRQMKTICSFVDGIQDAVSKADAKSRSQLQYLMSKQSSSSSLGRQNSIKSLKRFASNVYKSDSMLSKCSNALELAHQLYAIEYAYLSQIRLEEFVELISSGSIAECMSQAKENTLGSSCTPEKLPEMTISVYVRWFNHLSHLAATQIVKVNDLICPF